MTLKINSKGLVSQLIDRHRLWYDCKLFYKQQKKLLLEHFGQGIPCYSYTEVEHINKHRNTTIAIDCLTEGIHSINFFKRYEKSNLYLIFSAGNWDKNYYNFGINYHIMHHSFFLFEMADTFNTPQRFSYFTNKEYDFYTLKTYNFISTIGNVRPERDYLVDQLKNKIVDKQFLLRYSGQDINGSGDKDLLQFSAGNFDPYQKLLEKYFINVSQTLPIDMFNQAHFNLIVETDINWVNEFLLTEKTIKNLITGMPFVIVSTPYFLKNLRDLGFETYHELWDEGYDKIEDYQKRIDYIVNLCNNLAKFDWPANREHLKKIGQKNKLNFLNLNRVIDREFCAFENTIKNLK